MEPDLLPCPFCGTSNVELVLSGDYEHWQVACMQEDCGNDGPEAQYKGTAVALWNTRKETTLILETITIGEYTIKNINPFGEIGNFWIEKLRQLRKN